MKITDGRGGFTADGPGDPRQKAGQKLLEYQFPARPEQLCGLREKLRASLSCCCRSEETIHCMVLAVGEACMNVIQHAYGFGKTGDIIVEVWRKGESLVFRITDFADHKSCAEEMKSRPLDEIRPGGLGCHLINEIMDEVSLIECPAPCGNILQMTKTLEDDPDAVPGQGKMMKCNLRSENDIDILELGGEIDLQYSPTLREQILGALKRNRALLIDLGDVSYIDSSGIASLVEGLQTARKARLPYGLMRVSKAAAQVLSLTRLDQVFSMYGSLEDFRAELS